VVDESPWTGQYFLVDERWGEYVTTVPSSFHELVRVPEGVIVKGTDEKVEELIEQGIHIVRIHDGEIPLVERRKGRPGKVPDVWYGEDSYVVNQVSDSTLTDYVTRLEAFRTRYSYSDSVYAASQYIFDKFTEFGYTDVLFDSLAFPGPVQRNVVAIKFGSINPDRVIVIGAHYDSAVLPGVGCDPDTLAPGADDDASGVAVTMEAARVLADVDTEVTIIFIAYAAEEQGLWGSYHFAEEAFNQGMDIIVVLNMDEVGYVADEYWDVELNYGFLSSPFVHIVAEIATSHTDLIPDLTYPVIPYSDHYSFYQFGYDFVLVHNGDENPHIHRCTDTIENMSIPYLTDVTEMIAASALHIANSPQIPSGLNAVNVGDGMSVYLSWDPNTESDLSGYTIYYGTQSEVYDSVKVVPSTAAGDTIQNLIEGTTFYFAISATDLDGNESYPSEEVEIVVAERPLPPTGLLSASFEDSVVLDWDRNLGEMDIAGYNVYRYPAGEPQDPLLLGFVNDPTSSFSDNTAESHVLYVYYVTAIDTQATPNESDPSGEVRGRLATHDMGILVVDNTKDGAGGPYSPTDEEVDVFYDDLLEDYNVQAYWDVGDSAALARTIMDYDVGIYSAVVWHSDVRNSDPMVADTLTMERYLETGGNLWLSGWMLLSALTGEPGPSFIFEADDFVPHYMGIDSARTTTNADTDFIGASGLEGFPLLWVDPEKATVGGLFSMDILLPPFDETYPIYTYVSSDSSGSQYHGLPVGLASNSSSYGLVITDFPAFFMEESSAKYLASTVMELFGESVGIEGEELEKVPFTYTLSQNFPNPFNPSTTITFDIPESEKDAAEGDRILAALSIFDVRGRLVRVLLDEELTPGRYRVTWDGKNENGSEVSSGIYFYRITAGSFSSTRKMALIK
jgi:hypothetical protein